MNNRIKELAIQAGYMKDCFGFGHWDMPECENFATLIVQETILEVWIQLFNHGIDLSENTLFLEAMKKTKEKFGVE